MGNANLDEKIELLSQLSIDRDAPPPTRALPWGLVAAVALGATATAGYLAIPSNTALPVKLDTARLEAAPAAATGQSVLDASGYVVARRAATVSSKVTGRVADILVEEGMSVQKNQVVARLEDVNARQSVRVAEAELGTARSRVAEIEARVRETQVGYERSAALAAQGMISKAALDGARANADALKAQLASQEQSVAVNERVLEQQRQSIEDLVLRAPFSGVVVAKSAQLGEMISPVSAGSGFTRTGICTIVDMGSLDIEVDVNESHIHRVRAGQRVEASLDAYPGWKMPARVSAIIPTADRQKATVKVRIALDKTNPRILPDMGVKVAFLGLDPATQQKTALAPGIRIAPAALHKEGERQYVFVVKNNKTEQRQVTLGSSRTGEVLVTSGLSAGEEFVADAGPQVKAGITVTRQ
jgi:RND family efflux transporter MFP subunit